MNQEVENQVGGAEPTTESQNQEAATSTIEGGEALGNVEDPQPAEPTDSTEPAAAASTVSSEVNVEDKPDTYNVNGTSAA